MVTTTHKPYDADGNPKRWIFYGISNSALDTTAFRWLQDNKKRFLSMDKIRNIIPNEYQWDVHGDRSKRMNDHVRKLNRW